MANGSFNGLYTFEEIAYIYNIDASTIRKQVQQNKFIEDKEIKKFGKTWIITEKAVKEHYGTTLLNLYKQDEKLQSLKSVKKRITKETKSLDDEDSFDIPNSWVEEKYNEADVESSFKF